MKKYLSIFLLFLPMVLYAQDFILRAGSEVYKYNERTGMWFDRPLPLNSTLNSQDSIKSYTAFTLEVPLTWRNLFNKRIYTYIKYPDGVRLNKKLVEKKDRYTPIDTRVIVLGNNYTLIEHIGWLLNSPDSTSPFRVKMNIYNSVSWAPIERDSHVSLSTPITIAIINEEAFDVYTYILWRDNKWNVLGKTSECIRISPFSYYDTSITLSEPIGSQSLLLLCSQKLIPEDDILSLINGNHKATYNAEFGQSIGFDYKTFNLEK